MKIKNKNTNNNIIYLDLGDLEDLVMKKPKKKKKKRVDNKKKIVDEVKETLSIFDNLLKEAEEKKVKIPKELGELPINIEDINTIKELKALNEDLKQRISVISDLIQKNQPIMPQFQSIPSTAFGMSGFQQGLPTSITQAQQFLQQRQQQGIAEPITPQIPIVPQTPAQPSKDRLKEIQDQLKKREEDIISRLPKDEQEKARQKQKEIEDAKKRPLPTPPVQPPVIEPPETAPKIPSLSSGFEIIKPTNPEDIKILGESFEAPIGMYDEYYQANQGFVRRYIDKLKKDPRTDKFYITKKDFENFKIGRNQNLTIYENWRNRLNPTQRNSLVALSAPKTMNEAIESLLQESPIRILEELASQKRGKRVSVEVVDGFNPKGEPETEEQRKARIEALERADLAPDVPLQPEPALPEAAGFVFERLTPKQEAERETFNRFILQTQLHKSGKIPRPSQDVKAAAENLTVLISKRAEEVGVKSDAKKARDFLTNFNRAKAKKTYLAAGKGLLKLLDKYFT
jgi:hypothetical protein